MSLNDQENLSNGFEGLEGIENWRVSLPSYGEVLAQMNFGDLVSGTQNDKAVLQAASAGILKP